MSKNKKSKNKKKNESLAYHVCKLMGNIPKLDSALKRESNVVFAEALKECRIADPVYYCQIKRPVGIEVLMNKIADSSENGRYDGHNFYVIVPSLKYTKHDFNKNLNTSTIERFEIDGRVFYIFAEHDNGINTD